MPNRCAYCGREENLEENFMLHECPICRAIACPICLALIEFSEEMKDNMVGTWRAAICKVHLPWNIIEGIKKNAKEKDDESGDMSHM